MNYPRREFEMTEDDLKEILKFGKPVPYIIVGGMAPSSPQENANRAWAILGAKMGFESETVEPICSKGHRFFTAVPTASASAAASDYASANAAYAAEREWQLTRAVKYVNAKEGKAK